MCLVLIEAYSDFTPEEHEILRERILEAKNDIIIMPPPDLLLKHHKEPMFAAIHAAYRLGIIDQWIKNENPCEDYAYETYRQRQIDGAHNDTERLAKLGWSPKVIIGKDIPDDQKIKRFENFDPNPHIPFVSPKFPSMTKAEAFLYAAGWIAAIGAIVLVELSK